MKPAYRKRLDALRLLHRKESSTLEQTKRDVHRSRCSLDLADQALAVIRAEVERVEMRLRAGLGRDRVLSLDQLQSQGAYLVQQRLVETQKQDEHEQAAEEMKTTTDWLQSQYLKVKGLEDASARVSEQLRREDEKDAYRELDEAWVRNWSSKP